MGNEDSAVSDAEKKPDPSQAHDHPDEVSGSWSGHVLGGFGVVVHLSNRSMMTATIGVLSCPRTQSNISRRSR